LKGNILLYVRSEKGFFVEYSQTPTTHTGWWVDGYGALPMTTQITYNYKPEDQEAANLLKEAGITYKLIDLSNCSLKARLTAKISGINETPTLVFYHKKIKGIENIKQALQGIKA